MFTSGSSDRSTMVPSVLAFLNLASIACSMLVCPTSRTSADLFLRMQSLNDVSRLPMMFSPYSTLPCTSPPHLHGLVLALWSCCTSVPEVLSSMSLSSPWNLAWNMGNHLSLLLAMSSFMGLSLMPNVLGWWTTISASFPMSSFPGEFILLCSLMTPSTYSHDANLPPMHQSS